jgi:hypothetical protein
LYNPEAEALVSVITTQFPEFQGCSFQIITAGFDSVAVDVGDQWIFKFPRTAQTEESLRREAKLLQVLRDRITIPIPAVEQFEKPRVFTMHRKIPGDHLPPDKYNQLGDGTRDALAEEIALFYSQLHGLPVEMLADAGATDTHPWLPVETIEQKAIPLLPPNMHEWANESIRQYRELAPDPFGTIFGFFDGHGWNMAFDHLRGKLNGIYDFADSGFGPLHQDFIYTNFIARDLTLRVVSCYQGLTNKSLEIKRVDLLTSVLRLHELAEVADDPAGSKEVLPIVTQWWEDLAKT